MSAWGQIVHAQDTQEWVELCSQALIEVKAEVRHRTLLEAADALKTKYGVTNHATRDLLWMATLKEES